MIDRINGEDFLSEVRWYLSMLEVSHVNSYLLWMDVTNNDASCTRNTANASYRLSFWAPIFYRSSFSSSFPLQNLLKDGASYCSRTYSYILLNPPLLPLPLTPFLAPTLFYQGNNVSQYYMSNTNVFGWNNIINYDSDCQYSGSANICASSVAVPISEEHNC